MAERPSSRHGQPWSEADDAALVRLADEGLDVDEIGRRLGRTSRSVSLRLHPSTPEMPVAVNKAVDLAKRGRWSADEDAELVALVRGGASETEVSRQLNRTVAAVWRRLERLDPGLLDPPGSELEDLDVDLEAPDVLFLELLAEVIAGVEGRHADILQRRLGLGGREAQTLQEIGVIYGVTRERIRQLQVKALGRLRGRMRRLGDDTVEKRLLRRLRASLAAISGDDRGRFLRANFPESHAGVVGRTIGAVDRSVDDKRAIAWVVGFDDAVRQVERAAWADGVLARLLMATSTAAPPKLPAFERVRDVSEGGVFASARLGRNVQVESALEERFFRLLEAATIVERYCEQPIRIEYRWFDGPRIYVPDAAVVFAGGRCALVEVKPVPLWADALNVAKWNAAVRFCADRGWSFVVTDGRRIPAELAELEDPQGRDVLEAATAEGPAEWWQLEDWFTSGRGYKELLAVSLRYGFALQRGPLVVHRARNSPWLDSLRPATPL